MAKLVCRDYGFDCNYVAEGSQLDQVLLNFAKHTESEHGIEYSKEALMQFIIRKGNT
jgi:predicted small metal-binding protein